MALAGSQEYFALHGSTYKGFVDALYQDVLNRVPGAAEENNWIGVLNGGASLASVATAFLTSTEYLCRTKF